LASLTSSFSMCMKSRPYFTKGLIFFCAASATTAIATPFAVVITEKNNKTFVLAIRSTC
jgi:hypothetical protein